MSNIKTIVVNNETYNIEDAVARNLLSNVYNKDEINDRFAGLENYDDTAIKARIQALENAEETDPTVPSWAKAEHKPTYTASEVGALSSDTFIPDKLSDLTDDATHRLISDTKLAQIDTNKNDISVLKGTGAGSIDAMINDKINAWATQLTNDGTVNTYAEAIQWIADHGSDYTALLGDVSNKVDKVSGKGLSTNDLTDTLKNNYNAAYTHSQSSHARTDATKVESSTTNGNIKINGTETTVYTHPGSGTNPHGTTKSDVGLSNVPNVSTNDQKPSYTEATTLAKLTSGEKLSVAFGKISKAITDLISHLSDSVKHITSTERTNWNAAKTHADSAHAPSTAQANVIETVKVNGTALTPNNKAVDITVPNYTFEVKSDGHLYVSY